MQKKLDESSILGNFVWQINDQYLDLHDFFLFSRRRMARTRGFLTVGRAARPWASRNCRRGEVGFWRQQIAVPTRLYGGGDGGRDGEEGFDARDIASLNSEVGSLLGPLGDPDYDGDPMPGKPSHNTLAKSTAATTTAGAEQLLFGGGRTQNFSASPSLVSNTAIGGGTGAGVNARVQQIIEEHERSLMGVMQEVLSNHHTQLTAAIRTEMRLQEMKREEPR